MVPLLHRGKRPIPYSEELHSLDLPGFLQPPYKLQSSRVLDSVKVFDCKWSKNVAYADLYFARVAEARLYGAVKIE